MKDRARVVSTLEPHTPISSFIGHAVMAPSAQGLFQSVDAQYKDFMLHFIIFLNFVILSFLMLDLSVFALKS